MVKAYFFTGHGNYSVTHNWDKGISCHIIKRISLKKAYSLIHPNWLPCKAAITDTNSYGGSHNVEGVVFASSLSRAGALLPEIQKAFPTRIIF